MSYHQVGCLHLQAEQSHASALLMMLNLNENMGVLCLFLGPLDHCHPRQTYQQGMPSYVPVKRLSFQVWLRGYDLKRCLLLHTEAPRVSLGQKSRSSAARLRADPGRPRARLGEFWSESWGQPARDTGPR